MVDRVFRGRRVVLPDGVRAASVHVDGERIVAVRGYDDVPTGVPVVEAGDLVLTAGLVDTHVHVNEPGRTHWEGFTTATRAAAAGGVTAIVDMPLNSIPPTTTVSGLDAKRQAAGPQVWVDVGFWGGAVGSNVGDLAALHEAGVMGFKCFLCPSGVDEFPYVDEVALAVAMERCAALGALLIVHAEHPHALDAHSHDGDHHAHHDHAAWLDTRPREAEDRAIALLVELCRKYGTKTHVVHLSSASALHLLRAAKAEGLPLTAETCPHYLCLCHEDVPAGATEFKCAPPIRERHNQDLLWAALDEGLIEMVVTDHSPAPADLKHRDTGDFPCAWGGIASLQLGLSAVWTRHQSRGGRFEDVVRWMTEGPAKLVGLSGKKGRIAPGADADLVLWDPDGVDVVVGAQLQHRHPLTPYAGKALFGRARQTWIRGALVYDAGRFAPSPAGRLLTRP